MRTVILDNNRVVVNVINGVINGSVDAPDYVSIGWKLTPDDKWVPAPAPENQAVDVAELRGSMSLSAVDLRLRLRRTGLLAAVMAAAEADEEMGIWFEYSVTVHRTHPMVLAMATLFEKDDVWLDEFFLGKL